MKSSRVLSSYLVRPDLSRRRHRQWLAFRTQFSALAQDHGRTVYRLVGAVLIWSAFIASIQYIAAPHSRNAAATSSPAPLANAQTAGSHPSLIPAGAKTLAQVTSAKSLPSGPTGQLLPPGTMAPDRTYANSYARGQCTWYVAGRRQIPPGWGNAASWYSHAAAAGWAVGTTPAVAAIAWTPAGSYGHVALVEQISDDHTQVYVSEMNYRGIGIKSFRWVPAKEFKYIY